MTARTVVIFSGRLRQFILSGSFGLMLMKELTREKRGLYFSLSAIMLVQVSSTVSKSTA
ncbi:MAG: hypothetical protein H0V97_04115 [Actinobacteria bacterium]|nr:hypothetical protein [Actinomycetota bacterium]